MTLFKQYQAAVESLILQRLKDAVPGFSMEAFLEVRSLQCNVGTSHVASRRSFAVYSGGIGVVMKVKALSASVGQTGAAGV